MSNEVNIYAPIELDTVYTVVKQADMDPIKFPKPTLKSNLGKGYLTKVNGHWTLVREVKELLTSNTWSFGWSNQGHGWFAVRKSRNPQPFAKKFETKEELLSYAQHMCDDWNWEFAS